MRNVEWLCAFILKQMLLLLSFTKRYLFIKAFRYQLDAKYMYIQNKRDLIRASKFFPRYRWYPSLYNIIKIMISPNHLQSSWTIFRLHYTRHATGLKTKLLLRVPAHAPSRNCSRIAIVKKALRRQNRGGMRWRSDDACRNRDRQRSSNFSRTTRTASLCRKLDIPDIITGN